MITLELAKKEDLEQFKRGLQESFMKAVVENFEMNATSEELIPPDEDIEQSFNAEGAVVYHIVSEGKRVGGAVLQINEKTQHNELAFFFISVNEHSRGLGYKAWKAIEEKYPETKVWETCTPYFEKRNIHFYVNKCGFHIVEFFNKMHSDPHMAADEEMPGGEEFFRFEKVMN